MRRDNHYLQKKNYHYSLLPDQEDIQLLIDPSGSACLALPRNHTDPREKNKSVN